MEMGTFISYDNECCHIISRLVRILSRTKGNCLLLESNGWEPPSQNEPLLRYHPFPPALQVCNSPKSRPRREPQQIHFPVVSSAGVSSSTYLSIYLKTNTKPPRKNYFLTTCYIFRVYPRPIKTPAMNSVAYSQGRLLFLARISTRHHIPASSMLDSQQRRPGRHFLAPTGPGAAAGATFSARVPSSIS